VCLFRHGNPLSATRTGGSSRRTRPRAIRCTKTRLSTCHPGTNAEDTSKSAGLSRKMSTDDHSPLPCLLHTHRSLRPHAKRASRRLRRKTLCQAESSSSTYFFPNLSVDNQGRATVTAARPLDRTIDLRSTDRECPHFRRRAPPESWCRFSKSLSRTGPDQKAQYFIWSQRSTKICKDLACIEF